MAELDADRAAISRLQLGENLAQREHLAAEEITGVEHAVGRQGVQTEGFVGELEVREGLGERIDAGLDVPDHPVRLDGGEDLPLGAGVDGAGGGGAFTRLRREAEAEFEAFEERAPVTVDRRRVLGPLLVIRCDEVCVPPTADAEMFHFWPVKGK